MIESIRYSISFLLLLCFFTSHAQDKDYTFENFSTSQGLPHFSVNQILEDHYGFLWYATNSGLFRFDGYSLKSYLHNVHDTTSISSPGVEYIVEDKAGQIWVSTLYGINLLDRRTGTFSRFYPFPEDLSSKVNNFIHDLIVDDNNRLIAIGNEHLFFFDQKTKTFKIIQNRHPTRKHGRLKSFTSTSDGIVWCTAETGLLKILPSDTLYTYIQLDTVKTSRLNQGIYNLASGKDKTLWIQTNKGLVQFDTETLSITENILPSKYQSLRITAITILRNGHALLAFENYGLGVYRSKNDFDHYTHDDDMFLSIQNNQIRCIVEDQFDNIWLGTSAGISKINWNESGFERIQNKSGLDQQSNRINRAFKDWLGTIWMNTALGVYTKSPNSYFGKAIQIHPSLDSSTPIDFFFEDSEDNLYVSVYDQGLWRKLRHETRFERLYIGDSEQSIHIYKIMEDFADPTILWLGTSRGICKWNKESKQYQYFQPQEQHSTLQSNRIVVSEQYEHDIWLYYTYNNSIGRFDKLTEKYEIIDVPENKQFMFKGVFRDMTVTNDGNVWFATNFGLSQYNIKEKTFDILTQKDGLINNDLNAVILDSNHQLWVVGQQFIAKFDRETSKFTTYNQAKTVQKFISRSALLSKDGQILIGSLNGVLAFHPDSLREDPFSPRVLLTDFKVHDTTFLLEQAFEETKEIKLSYKQNDISFVFSSIHHVGPKSIQYRCLLEGYDDNWRDLGRDHHVSYTNLNAGQFTFRLQASKANGIWNEDGLHIAVLIAPPFTQTIGFRALILIFLATLAYLLFKSRQNRLLLNAQKEFAEKSAAYKTQFLADVSHEIRTPMNAIIGLSTLTLETQLDTKQTNFVRAIQESSKNLLGIINDLLDHTKLEAGKFTFVKKSFELGDITRMLNNTFQYIALEKALHFEIVVNPSIAQKLIGDPTRLNQILTNLIGNAIKFTEKGNVWLIIDIAAESEEDIKLRFEVGDTGIGIPRDKIDSIFDSFSQAEGGINKGMEGTGLGLSIAQQMVEKQGGKLFINSVLGEGTKLWFELSFGKVTNTKQHQINTDKAFALSELRVMVVEDTLFNQMLVIELLKKHIETPTISIADNGKIALEKLKEQSFDIILMDVKMQVMDGFEATKHIRNMADPRIKDIPILAVTASAVPEQLMKCKAAGMNDYVTKPIDEYELMEKIYALTKGYL